GGSFGPQSKVVAGYDFAQNDGDPNATWQHGTAVAGVLASQDPAHPGIAPGADIAAPRVFGNDNKGSYARIADALQWVVDNHDRYNISVVNLSLSDGGNYSTDFFSNDGGIGQRIAGLVEQLEGLDIPVVTAAGNSFDPKQPDQGMGFIAILADTISVTAIDGADHLASDAQRLGASQGGASATDIAAPGVGLTAPVQGNAFAT